MIVIERVTEPQGFIADKMYVRLVNEKGDFVYTDETDLYDPTRKEVRFLSRNDIEVPIRSN